jgi:competence protein ComEC
VSHLVAVPRAEQRPDLGASPAQRAIFGACASVFAGTLTGTSLGLGREAWALASCASLLACLLSFFVRLAPTSRIRFLAPFLLLTCAAGWRANADSPRPEADEATPAGKDVAAEARVGVWSTSGDFGDEERGTIEGGSERFDLSAGIVDDGETIAILTCEARRSWPRGPEPGLSAASGFSHPADRVLPDEIVRLARPSDGIARRAASEIAGWRARLLERCSGLEEPLTRALVKALLFGDMSEMPREVSDLFVRVGTYHVLAISGSQVGLVAILILWPLSRAIAGAIRRATFGRLALAPEILHVALLLLFVPIAGAGAPVLRSALCYALGSCAPRAPMSRAFAVVRGRPMRLGRKANSLSLWSMALTAECLLHSSAPRAVSVQLSYGATLGLILGTGPIMRRLRDAFPAGARIAPVDALGRARSSAWRVPAQRSIDLVLCSIAASLAAVLATLPFVWSRFGEWSPVGILATPALGLPVACIVALGWVWMCFPWAVPQILIDLPARAAIAEMKLFDGMPGSPDPLPPRPLALLLLATALTLAWLARARRAAESMHQHSAHHDSTDRGSARADLVAPENAHANEARSTLLGRLALASWSILLLPWALAPARFEMWALDVGHGTCVVLRAPGSDTWIFDAGSRDRPDVAREALLPLLRRWEVGDVGIVLSHTDRDHDGALPYVMERYPPRVWAGALPAQCAERLPHTTLVVDAGPGRAELPELDSRGEDLGLELWRGSLHAANEGSRSLFVRYRGESVLLSGDAEAEGLSEMLRRNRAADRVEDPLRLLLFPHHGSDTDLIGELLASTRPSEIWISCSGPAAVSTELERRGIRCRTTAEDGPLALELHDPGESVATDP